MFEKLLANLPYNPNLTKQIAFYAKRLKREESIRRTGIIFMLLAFTVQFMAFLSPPQPTTAYSTSDMVNGGISSKQDAVRACRDNIKNYGDALWNFKINCGDLANAEVTNVRSTDYDNRLFSMSWLPYGQTNPHSGKPTDETPMNLAKVSETLYGRRLSSADTIPFSTYQVLKGTANGKVFFIMFGCGNLMLVGVPNPEPTCQYEGEFYYKGDERCNPPDDFAQPVCPYNPAIRINNPRCKPDQVEPLCPFDQSLPKNSKKCVPCPYNQNIAKSDAKCKPCDAAVGSANGLACIVESKSASNLTQNLPDANNTTAQPNDVIIYTLFAENKGKKTVERFVMQENLSDVMDYADIVSLGKGKISKTGLVSWPAVAVKPGTTITRKIEVRIKNPLPTNSPTVADPNHYDHIMTNVYGNTVTIKLPLPPGVAPVAVVSTSEALPKTGPAESLALVAAVVIVAGYFFARTRLLVDESMIVVQQKTSGGL